MESNTIQATPPFVQFLEFHKPVLNIGTYEITVTQTVTSSKIPSGEQHSFSQAATFHVNGEQFQIKPADLNMIFPAENSNGEHGNVLPHIILNRSTLPWERSAVAGQSYSWLALLVFHEGEEEAFQTNNVKLGQLKAPQSNSSQWPGINDTLQPQEAAGTIEIVDVKWQLLREILPLTKDLSFLAHVRQGLDLSKKPVGDEKAVIVANRLPFKGGMTTVHLVSLENRYDSSGFVDTGLNNDDLVRLVSMKSWKFYCESKNSYKITDRVLDKFRRLHFYESDLTKFNAVKNEEVIGSAEFIAEVTNKSGINFSADDKLILLKNAVFHKQTFKGLLEHLQKDTLKLPSVNDAQADAYLKDSFAPLSHHFRVGQQSVSWYRGPLISGTNQETPIELPVQLGDQLVRYHATLGMFDVSYAAAWELGRLLLLSSKRTAVNLYQWKRKHYQRRCQAEQLLAHPHLVPHAQNATNQLEIPNQIRDWFKNLSLLKGIPFNYLVPHENMLPPESIRFFKLDSQWINCLLDGAFSLGRAASHDHRVDKDNDHAPKTEPDHNISGFILRSEVVAGWPEIMVDAYSVKAAGVENITTDKKLSLLRKENLSKNVMICLFKGELGTLDLHQKPETLHFGLDLTEEEGVYYKQLRNKNGQQIAERVAAIPWKNKNLEVVNVNGNQGLGSKIASHNTQTGFSNITAAEFGLLMLEGVQNVRFINS